MSAIEVVAKKNGREVVTNYDFGDNLNEATEKFTADVVFTNFRQAAKISLQAIIRRGIEKGLDDNAIAQQCATWKPGVALERTIDPATSIMAKWNTLPPEQRAELLKQLKQNQG